jgi:isoleucyl-tRNA synthetase
MHGSWGNTIDFEDAVAQMGADVMRWQYCAQPPDRNLLFGFGPAHEVKGKLIRIWNSVKFLVLYANVEGFEPTYADLEQGPPAEQPLDRWLVARTQQLVGDVTAALEAQLTHRAIDAFESFHDDLSNWYVRRSRRRFYAYDDAAFRTLWYALAQSLRAIAPIMPFVSEHLWRTLVAAQCPEAPASVFLAPWPAVDERLADATLLAEIDEVRRIVALGGNARNSRGVKLRQPLRRAVVYGAELAQAHAAGIAEELNVKEVAFERAARVRYKPNLPVLGPRLGPKLPAVRKALEEGRYELVLGDQVLVEGETLSTDELLTERDQVNDGWAGASEGALSIELDTELDEELLLEGRVRDLIRRLNDMRKDAGLEVTDRIRVRLPGELEALLAHEERIKSEVLAVAIDLDGGEPLRIEKV